jgi:hypothetical protein
MTSSTAVNKCGSWENNKHGRESERARGPPAGACAGQRHDQRCAHVEGANLGLSQSLREVQRHHPLENPERERGEQYRRRSNPEGAGAQRPAVGGELTPCERRID